MSSVQYTIIFYEYKKLQVFMVSSIRRCNFKINLGSFVFKKNATAYKSLDLVRTKLKCDVINASRRPTVCHNHLLHCPSIYFAAMFTLSYSMSQTILFFSRPLSIFKEFVQSYQRSYYGAS